MKRRVTILCVVALALALGVVAWIYLSPPEPAYQGKPLSAWMDESEKCSSSDRARGDQARAAIRQIGTNALPALLRLAAAKDSALKKGLIALANKQSFIRFRLHPANYYHARATYGFSALGPIAKPAVPGLIGLLQDKDPEVRASAAQCLCLLGPEASEAVPALLQTLNAEGNGYGPVLINSMLALGAIHAEPETVLPVLLQNVNGPRKDWNYCAPAMQAIGFYRQKAKSAVPAILPFLAAPDESHRSAADFALTLIDPKAVAPAQKR